MAEAPTDAVVHRLLVLADDLTGAADAAAPFAVRGLEVSVALSGRAREDVEVLALVTDNRWRRAAEAQERMRSAVRRARRWSPQLLFVKVDSTLRGRVRADVAVALDAWGHSRAVATPAFPGQGRTVSGGALAVHGRTTVDRVADHFPCGVRVVDAVSHEDLVATARGVVDDGAVAIGSGGLARALADVLVPYPRPRPSAAAGVSGVLVVVGTAHPTTRAQVAHLLADGAEPLAVVSGAPAPVDAAVRALRAGRRVVLTCEVDGEVEEDSPRAALLADDLARVVRDVVAAAGSIALVLTGGATALAVVTALGADELRLRSEVSEGLPLGELVIGDRRIPAVTKSGGFGAQDCLCRAAEALEECA